MGGSTESAIIVGTVIGGCCFCLLCYIFVKWIQQKRKEQKKAERRKKRKNRIHDSDEGGDIPNEPIVIHAD
jgi:uncharacterized protein (DUF2062 family)